MTTERPEPPLIAGERETGYLARWGVDVSLRLVMHHMIHEYARHNGHAGFLREAIDGTVGA